MRLSVYLGLCTCEGLVEGQGFRASFKEYSALCCQHRKCFACTPVFVCPPVLHPLEHELEL